MDEVAYGKLCEVGRRLCQVFSRLRVDFRYAFEHLAQCRLLLIGERQGIVVLLVRRFRAIVGKAEQIVNRLEKIGRVDARAGIACEHRVETGIASPGPVLLVVELQRVHFRTNEVVVGLLPHWPIRRVDRGQIVLEFLQAAILVFHRSYSVVGNPLYDGCLLKLAELKEQVDEIVVGLTGSDTRFQHDAKPDQQNIRENRIDFVHGLSNQGAD